MRIIKIESCRHCHRCRNEYCNETGLYLNYDFVTSLKIHPECKLDKYIDIEAIKDLCKMHNLTSMF